MAVPEKNKTTDNKIKQNKVHYKLDRQAAKISTFSSGNVGKFDFLTVEDILPEKRLLQKAATIKRFEYLLLGRELKKQPSIAEKQFKRFDSDVKKLVMKNQQLKNITDQINSPTDPLSFANLITLITISRIKTFTYK